jgi:hypothetical protein|tara:strand:- start:1559 stop:1852 length:294 start_codon:yes stop_codon:yes gene_type:complete
MISYTISSKATKKPLEDCEVIKTSKIENVLKKCKEFNKELSSDVYISKVFSRSSGINYKYLLDFDVKPLKTMKITGGKHSILGSNAFNCDYVVPVEI